MAPFVDVAHVKEVKYDWPYAVGATMIAKKRYKFMTAMLRTAHRPSVFVFDGDPAVIARLARLVICMRSQLALWPARFVSAAG